MNMEFHRTSNMGISLNSCKKYINPEISSISSFNLYYARLKNNTSVFFLKIATIFLVIFIFHYCNFTYYGPFPNRYELQTKSEIYERFLLEQELELSGGTQENVLCYGYIENKENCRENWRKQTKEIKKQIVSKWLMKKKMDREREEAEAEEEGAGEEGAGEAIRKVKRARG